ncbi:MAG: adenosylhomocysteinase, partial [Thermoleophilaceae bacterium]
LCASNPLSTQDDVAAALVERHGAEVRAIFGEDVETYHRHLDEVVSGAPHVTMDDGADVVSHVHGQRPDLLEGIVGGTEATTTGTIRLRALEAEGRLTFPVIAAGEARTQELFDDRYGTGQSTLDGILRATNILLAGSVVVVIGYGGCGRGVALRAQGAGARVIVCEVDPLRALEASMDGFAVRRAVEAAASGDVFITVTGGRDALTGEHFARMKDGAILANAGHFDVEIDLRELRAAAAGDPEEVLPLVEQYDLRGRRLNLLAGGRVVNLAAGEGHPAAVMDMSFATQALAVEHLVRSGPELEPRVLDVPNAIDAEIAGLKLAALGVEIDELTEEQRSYLHSWG